MFNSILRKLFPANFIFKAIEVYPGLFQGNKISTDQDIDEVRNLKISSIIDLEVGLIHP